MLVAPLVLLASVIDVDVVEAKHVSSAVEAAITDALCDALAARRGVPRGPSCGAAAPASDRLEVRIFGGATRVLVSVLRTEGQRSASTPLPLDRPEAWAPELRALVGSLVEPPPRALGDPLPVADPPPLLPWICAGGGAAAAGAGAVFFGLAQGAAGTLEAQAYSSPNHGALVAEAARHRTVAWALIGVSVASVAAAIILAAVE